MRGEERIGKEKERERRVEDGKHGDVYDIKDELIKNVK